MKPKAFIFDLDGVITDTANYHYLAWKNLADELGFVFDRKINERLKGVSRIRSFEIILEVNNALDKFTEEEKNNIANRKNDEYVELIKQITPKDTLPNMLEFLQEAKENGIKLAVASASKNVFSVLKYLDLESMFDYVADAGKVKNSKPDPEVFLVCIQALGLQANECVGFEDAQSGIEAIHASKMMSVGINVDITTITPDVVLKSTEELNLEKIIEAFENYSK